MGRPPPPHALIAARPAADAGVVQRQGAKIAENMTFNNTHFG
jgi:hypothetical protein